MVSVAVTLLQKTGESLHVQQNGRLMWLGSTRHLRWTDNHRIRNIRDRIASDIAVVRTWGRMALTRLALRVGFR